MSYGKYIPLFLMKIHSRSVAHVLTGTYVDVATQGTRGHKGSPRTLKYAVLSIKFLSQCHTHTHAYPQAYITVLERILS